MSYTGKWVDYTYDSIGEINAQLGNAARVEIDDEGMDNHVLIHLPNGKTLVIRYDYIYEWQVIDTPMPVAPVDTPATPTSITEVYDDATGELLAQYVDSIYGSPIDNSINLWMAMGRKLRFSKKTFVDMGDMINGPTHFAS